jgi:hypothetical protein
MDARGRTTEAGGSRLLHAYLVELGRQLDVPWRLRRRVLAETADHLLEAAEGERRRGRPAPAAERAAIARFGEAGAIARHFVDQLAAASVHRATDAVAAVLAGLCVAAMPFLGMAGSWTAGFPSGAVAGVAAQVAVVAGGLGLLRSLARRRAATIPPEELRLLVRGNATALAATAASLLAESLLALRHRDELLGSPGLLLFAALLAALWPATGVAALAVARAAVRAAKARPPAAAPAPPCGDVLEDLARLAGLVRDWVETRLPALLPAVDAACRVGRAAAILVERRAPWVLPWVDLRRHPWRFCSVVAGAAVAATFAGGVVPLLGERQAYPPAGVLAGALLEGAAVVLGFALLGGFLGIRRPTRLARSLARW